MSELVKLGLVKDTTKAKSIVQQASESSSGPAIGETKGLNPAHGQPGHRCDIAVGAPLNAVPTQQGQNGTVQSQQTVQVNPNQTNGITSTSVSPVKVGKGMNPAHGQPGHRCDIAVGAPLNSPVTKTAVAPASQNGTVEQKITVTPPPSNPSVPALLSTESANAKPVTVEGANPAHGQPGHRCDVAVGAPLPKS